MGEDDLVGIPQLAEFGDILYVDIIRRDDVQADTVEADVYPLREDRLVVFDVPGIGHVAYHDLFQIGTLFDEQFGLLDPAGRTVRVGDDGHARGLLGHNRGLQDTCLIGRYLAPGADLDHPRLDAALADALGDLFDKEFGYHLGDVSAPDYPRLPIGRRSFVLGIEAGGADDIDARLLGQLFVELRVTASHVIGRGIDDGFNTHGLRRLDDAEVGFQCGLVILRRDGRIRKPARVGEGEVFVHKRCAQLVRRNRSPHRVDHAGRRYLCPRGCRASQHKQDTEDGY